MIQAWNNYVILKAEDAGGESSHGLIIVGQVVPPATGRIVSVGPDAQIDFAVGQRVLYPPYGVAEEVRLDGEKYVFLLDHEILGVINAEG